MSTVAFLFTVAACTLAAQTRVTPAQRVFAPYADMGNANIDLPPMPTDSGIHWYTLAFINAGRGCTPAWPGMKTLAKDATIQEHIQAVREHGGEIIVAFGGYNGTELAQACGDAKLLAAAYQQVVSRYHAQAVDFDVEHLALADQASIDRRSEALMKLAAANPKLRIHLTLPAVPSGLTAESLNVLKSFLSHGVPLAVVNVMAMNYGSPVAEGGMGANAILAAKAAQVQLKTLGTDVAIGITPMIGVNDSAGETFTLADADAVVAYALQNPHIALLAFWSAGRDNGDCAGTASPLPSCSGIAQKAWAFTQIFSRFR
jgi:hypothetical protein